jgi:ubiquinone/menaquinone biosynthesis C-methylase UbiE
MSASPTLATPGAVLNWGWRYDLLVWLVDRASGGRLTALRQRTLDTANLTSGGHVLDVGCGTGSLAIDAWPRVAPTGRVVGIDPAPRQIGRARSRAARLRRPVEFQMGVIEQLEFADASFDAAFSTLMMHHLPDDLKRRGLAEVARVLRPGGRFVVVDAEHSGKHGHGGRRTGMGQLGGEELPGLLAEHGFAEIGSRQERLLPLHGFGQARIVWGTRK